MAAELSTAIDAGEDAQLAAASRIAVARFTPVPGSTNLDELLLDRVLRSGRGHPLVLAIVLAEAGRRAGLPLGVLRQGERSLVGHGLVSQPRVIDLDACGVLRDVAGAESTLRWIGPGETGSALAQLLDTAARAAEADRLLAVLSALRGPAGVG